MKRLTCLTLVLLLTIALLPAYATAESKNYYASTTLYGSSSSKLNNIEAAVRIIDGTELSCGETFSFNDALGARTRAKGYLPAKNGRGVSVVGGGVAQVATTMYLALLKLDDVEFGEVKTYNDRFADNYVDNGYYAVMTDYNADIDFTFTNTYSGTMRIWLWDDGSDLWCNVELEGSGGSGEMIGYAQTPLYYASSGNLTNIEICAESVFGAALGHRDKFSFNDTVGPRTSRYGYVKGVNGRGATVVGGGVAQVASTIYLAVRDLSCVSVTEKKVYSNFTGDYVDESDAAIVTDYNAGTDFAFRYTGYGTLTIYTYVSGDYLVCEVYEE